MLLQVFDARHGPLHNHVGQGGTVKAHAGLVFPQRVLLDRQDVADPFVGQAADDRMLLGIGIVAFAGAGILHAVQRAKARRAISDEPQS
jgi:hypothetical protein